MWCVIVRLGLEDGYLSVGGFETESKGLYSIGSGGLVFASCFGNLVEGVYTGRERKKERGSTYSSSLSRSTEVIVKDSKRQQS